MPNKLVQLTVPADHEDEAISVLHDDSRIKGLVFLQAGEDTSVMQFRVEDKDALRVLTRLQEKGVGVRFGFCDVMQLVGGTAVGDEDYSLHFDDKPLSLTPAEIYESIVGKATFSRDSMILLCISAIICGIGLASDNGNLVVASMLMSPLMGPIVGASFGLATFSRRLFINGWRNIIVMLMITIIISVLLGIAFSPFANALLWPTDQMTSRGINIELLFGALVAIAGGAAVAVAECNANVPSIVGIGIAASLLPPTVNFGICLGSVFVGPFVAPNIFFNEDLYLEIVWGSLLLVVVNVFLIYSTAFCVFKMITPLQQFRFTAAENKDLGLNLGASLFQRTLYRAQQQRKSAESSPHHSVLSSSTPVNGATDRGRFSSLG